MRRIACEQGSEEWMMARLGIPTASSFDKIVTPTGKPSAQADRYLARLAAEWYLGQPLDEDSHGTQFMARGTDMEPEAVGFYEFDTGLDTETVGLCLTDDRRVGASPDRLVGDDGLLEIKCPSAEVQMTYVLGGVTADYKLQLQGQLWVTGRKWVDLLCYHPTLPRVKARFERDEKFIGILSTEVGAFVVKLEEARARLMPDKSEFDAKQREAVMAAVEAADHPFG